MSRIWRKKSVPLQILCFNDHCIQRTASLSAYREINDERECAYARQSPRRQTEAEPCRLQFSFHGESEFTEQVKQGVQLQQPSGVRKNQGCVPTPFSPHLGSNMWNIIVLFN